MNQTNTNQIDPLAREDIQELRDKISKFRNGNIDEEKFKSYRLTRGVYGQRQPGVQMLRIKIPGGTINSDQLVRIADLSEKYTNGNLHITTRQDIQLHYVHLEDSPEIWESLEEVGITTKEACGNTVRNITVSSLAGFDPDELFDVTPYAEAAFRFFLRNPVCQEMGRKVKIAFSSSDKDSALTFLHDFGLIPRIRTVDGKEQKGFKVVLGGGLGAQAIPAKDGPDFLPADELLPFIEAGLRVFDRYGEREKRHKARLKYLLDERRGLGLEKFLELLTEEKDALSVQKIPIEYAEPQIISPAVIQGPDLSENPEYQQWLKTNVVRQKQSDLNVIKVNVPLGDISSEDARKLAALSSRYGSGKFRLTINQGIYFLHVPTGSLSFFYEALKTINMAEYGAETLADITACPGTDTCNLGVTNSTAISDVLEEVIRNEYAHLIGERDIHIKISGCMNSCGQHMIANIGFHGSSIKNDLKVVPALQVVLGGGLSPDGQGLIAEKIIKLPTKRIPQALRLILDDYEAYDASEEYFNRYVQHKGKRYFYDLLKPLADLNSLTDDEYIDWGEEIAFIPEIGVGECAGVTYDVVGTILQDAVEKTEAAEKSLEANRIADAAYHAYSAFVIAAKGLLLSVDVQCNTHISIIQDFDEHFVASGKFSFEPSFQEFVLRKESYNDERAREYLAEARKFVQEVISYRGRQFEEKEVIGNYYKA